MGLPLPKVIPDVGPGGGLVTAMGGMNSLANDMLLRKINQIKAQYAPLTAQADAASKLAYANLMGPQFLAKLLGNEGALGNLSEQQKKNLLQTVYGAGTAPTGLNALNQLPAHTGIGQPSTNTFSGMLKNAFNGLFNQQGKQQNPMQQQAMPNPMVQQQQQMAPQGQAPSRQPQVGDVVQGEGSNIPGYDEAFNAWQNSPEGKRELAKGENANIPEPEEVIQWYRNKKGDPTMNLTLTGGNVDPTGRNQPTYAENTGRYKGIVEEGTESGKIRAKDIDKLNDTVFNAETNQVTLDDLANILSSPEFEQIRQVPLAGHHELAYYAKEGTKEQQDMVGRYYTLTGNLIKDASRDFAGQFRKGEQQLLNGMKPGPQDTVDTAKGKTESFSFLNKMISQRSRLTSKLMSQNHINKLEAMEIADKQINGEEIRKQVRDRLHPTITIRNKKTGETKTISVAEARKLGVPNV